VRLSRLAAVCLVISTSVVMVPGSVFAQDIDNLASLDLRAAVVASATHQPLALTLRRPRGSKLSRLRNRQGPGPLPMLNFPSVLCGGNYPGDSCLIEVAPGSLLLVRRENVAVTADDNGIEITREAILPTLVGNIVLSEAHLILERGPSPYGGVIGGFQTIRGEVRLPFPGVGLLQQIGGEMETQPMAQLGLDLGRNLRQEDVNDPCFAAGECLCTDFCIDAPFPHGDSLYWFFQVTAGYSAKLGPFTLASPSAGGLMVFDPLDPFFFLSGELDGFEKKSKDPNGEPQDISGSFGVGFSWNGEIPFTPASTYGLDGNIPPFTGNFIIRGSGPLPPLPLSFSGERVFALDPEHDGDNPFTPLTFALSPDLAYAGNGTLDVSIPFLKVLSFGFELGTATVGVNVSSQGSQAYFSGTLDPENPLGFLPSNMMIPMPVTGNLEVAGLVTTEPGNWFVQAQGGFGIDTSVLAELVSQKLNFVQTNEGHLLIDKDGFLLQGTTDSQLFSGAMQERTAGVEAFVAANGADSHLTLSTALLVSGQELNGGALTVSPSGIAVSGQLTVGSTNFDMTGEFKPSGPILHGSAIVPIHYSREDTAKKLQLIASIATQQDVVDLATTDLANAQSDLAGKQKAFDDAQAAVTAAQSEVDSWQAKIDQNDADQASLGSQLSAQQSRVCSASYSGCGSCSCTSRCNCGKFDLVCKADCTLCEAGLPACNVARDACAEANRVACEADKAAKIASLQTQIAALQTARATLVASKDAATAVLNTAQGTLAVVRGPFDVAKAAVDAAQASYDDAVKGLMLLQQQLDNLPDIQGDVLATVTIAIAGQDVSGTVDATFEGMPIADGRVDLSGTPRRACITAPISGAPQEFCAPL